MLKYATKLLLAVILMLEGVSLSADGKAPLRRFPDAVPGQYIVGVRVDRPQAIPGLGQSLASTYGGRMLDFYETALHAILLEVPQQNLEALRDDARVRWVEQNAYLGLNMPVLSQSTYFYDNGWHDLWYLDRLDEKYAGEMDGSYEYCTTGDDINVYLIDIPVDANHPQFWNVNVETRNFFDDDEFAPANVCGSQSIVQSVNSFHGTAVASLIAGKDLGVAKGVNLISLGTHTCAGITTIDRVISALNWVVSPGTASWNDKIAVQFRDWARNPRYNEPAIINWSGWAIPEESAELGVGEGFTSIEEAVDGVEGRGALIITSADNYSMDSEYFAPNNRFYRDVYYAQYDVTVAEGSVIVVGGTELKTGLDPWGQWEVQDHRWQVPGKVGPDSGSNGGNINLWAPAKDITVAVNSGNPWGVDYIVYSGTSFSAPLVSGMAARVMRSFKGDYGRYPQNFEVWRMLRDMSTSEDSHGMDLVKSTFAPGGRFADPHDPGTEKVFPGTTTPNVGMLHWEEGLCSRRRPVSYP